MAFYSLFVSVQPSDNLSHMIRYLSDGMLLFSVPPPVHEDPVHNYMLVPHGEAYPVTHIPVTLALQVPVMLSKKRKVNQ